MCKELTRPKAKIDYTISIKLFNVSTDYCYNCGASPVIVHYDCILQRFSNWSLRPHYMGGSHIVPRASGIIII